MKKGYNAVGVVVHPRVRRAMRNAVGLIAAVYVNRRGVEGGVKPRVGVRRNREQAQR